MTPQRTRWLKLARWHVSEAYLCESLRQDDDAAYHLDAAREYAAFLLGASCAGKTLDELSALVCVAEETKTVR